MIKTGETVTVESVVLGEEALSDIRELPHVFDMTYSGQTLTVLCAVRGAQHNLVRTY